MYFLPRVEVLSHSPSFQYQPKYEKKWFDQDFHGRRDYFSLTFFNFSYSDSNVTSPVAFISLLAPNLFNSSGLKASLWEKVYLKQKNTPKIRYCDYIIVKFVDKYYFAYYFYPCPLYINGYKLENMSWYFYHWDLMRNFFFIIYFIT